MNTYPVTWPVTGLAVMRDEFAAYGFITRVNEDGETALVSFEHGEKTVRLSEFVSPWKHEGHGFRRVHGSFEVVIEGDIDSGGWYAYGMVPRGFRSMDDGLAHDDYELDAGGDLHSIIEHSDNWLAARYAEEQEYEAYLEAQEAKRETQREVSG